MVAVVAAIIFVERGHRRITVQYAKRVVGRRMYGGSSTHIPLKVNTGGVIPVIFASSILAFPTTFAPMFAPDSLADAALPSRSRPWHAAPQPALRAGIIFFCYFYTAIIFNPDDVAENMRKYGGFIPGHPPRQADGGVHRHDPDADHAGRRHLPGDRGVLPEFLISGSRGADPVDRRALDAMLPRFITEGLGVHVLLRRHVAPDRRRRGDGHGAPGRVAADHAALRRVHEEDPDSGTARLTVGLTRRVVMLGPPGGARARRRSGVAARTGSPRSRPATSCARRCRAALELGSPGGGDGARRPGRRRPDDRHRAERLAPTTPRGVCARRVSADGAQARRSTDR